MVRHHGLVEETRGTGRQRAVPHAGLEADRDDRDAQRWERGGLAASPATTSRSWSRSSGLPPSSVRHAAQRARRKPGLDAHPGRGLLTALTGTNVWWSIDGVSVARNQPL